MNRRLLLVTGLFYIALGVGLYNPTSARLLVPAVLVRFLLKALFGGFFSLALLLAGLLSLVASITYHAHWLRILAAGVRAGSMSALTILVMLIALFGHHVSVLTIAVFVYLTLLSFLTIPPPFPEPLEQAIDQLHADAEDQSAAHS